MNSAHHIQQYLIRWITAVHTTIKLSLGEITNHLALIIQFRIVRLQPAVKFDASFSGSKLIEGHVGNRTHTKELIAGTHRCPSGS